MKKEETRNIVKEAYGKIAKRESGCGCGTSCVPDAQDFAKSLGYSDDELQNIPTTANLGLSCGNPIIAAGLKEGETVLDLGSGAGFDCFIAAKFIGLNGKVIGVDMTREMIEKAINNAQNSNVTNVEFVLGEIENLPIADNSVEVVISNCVINLSPDKQKAFNEVFRVLKPGGRIAISDIALLKELPKDIQQNQESYTACIAGAILVEEYKKIVENTGLQGIKLTEKETAICLETDNSQAVTITAEDNSSVKDSVVSILVTAYKPR